MIGMFYRNPFIKNTQKAVVGTKAADRTAGKSVP